jgi:hypothetical protein
MKGMLGNGDGHHGRAGHHRHDGVGRDHHAGTWSTAIMVVMDIMSCGVG